MMSQKLKTKKLFYGKYPYKVTAKFETPIRYEIRHMHPSLFNNENIKTRFERNIVDFYTLDYNLHEQILQELGNVVKSVTEPENESALEKMSENKKFVICDKLPYGKFKYKITIKYIGYDDVDNLKSWCCKYSKDQVFLAGNIHRKYRYLWYVYVSDPKYITMLALIVGNKISKIEEYVLNTSLELA